MNELESKEMLRLSKAASEQAEGVMDAAASGTVKVYKAIETGTVKGYKAIEGAVVGTYTKIEDAFVGAFLRREGETTEEAKARVRAQVNGGRAPAEKKEDADTEPAAPSREETK